MSKYSLSAELCQKNSKKRPKYEILSDAGELLRTQIISHNYNKRLVSAHYDVADDLKENIKNQIRKSLTCRSRLHVDETGRINVEFSCHFMGCMPCSNAWAYRKILGFFPYIQKVFQKSQEEKFSPNWWFLTLTVPTCEAIDLEKRLFMLQKAWLYIQKKAKKSGIKYWDGVRKLEINHSLKKELRGVRKGENKDDFMYHAHFHFLVLSRETGRLVKQWWLRWWEKQGVKACNQAQDLVQVGDSKKQAYDGKNKPVKVLMELLKYVSKPIVTVNQDREGDFKAALHIYNCLSRKHRVEPFGRIRKMISNRGQIEAWVKSLSEEEVDALNLGFLRKKYANRDGVEQATGEALDSGEVGRYVDEDKDYLLGKTFMYAPKHLKYICRETGESLTTSCDFDETNKRHISQNIVRQARRYKLFDDRLDICKVVGQLAEHYGQRLSSENLAILEVLEKMYAAEENSLPDVFKKIRNSLSTTPKVTHTIADGPIKVERDDLGNDLFMQSIVNCDKVKFDQMLPYADFLSANKMGDTCVHLAVRGDDKYYIEEMIARGWGRFNVKNKMMMLPSDYLRDDSDFKKKLLCIEKKERDQEKNNGKFWANFMRKKDKKTTVRERIRSEMEIQRAQLVDDEDVSTVLSVVADFTQHNIGARLKKSDLDVLKAITDSPRGQAIRYDHETDRVYVPHINKWLDFHKKTKQNG